MSYKLKDELNSDYITNLANVAQQEHPVFDSARFVQSVSNNHWEAMELKDRSRHIARQLRACLPEEYTKALPIVTRISSMFSGLQHFPFPCFIELFGVEHFDASTQALAQITHGSSSEFAVRPFINNYPQHMLDILRSWTRHESDHVRRLASESCRPRLPWAPPLRQFIKDPTPILPLLETLRADESGYVRRSVANNLNDIAKDHPKLVLELTKKWLGNSKDTDALLKHACRTLLKQGNTSAMRLFGFGPPKGTYVEKIHFLPDPVAIGETGELGFTLRVNEGPQKLRLEYAIHYVKKNNSTSRKVFQLSEKTYEKGNYAFTKRRSFQELSTRKHWPGTHVLEIMVNGVSMAKKNFIVTPQMV